MDDNWRQIRKIFDEAVSLIPEERQNYITEVCGDDKTLLAEVESLLSSLDGADSFLETPAVAKVADIIEAETKKLAIGNQFGHYEIIEQIGAGGMGEVYLAKDKKLDRQVAVKILSREFSREESNLNRFIVEAKAASGLNHPNILTIYEFGETDNAHYIISEFIKGKTLRETLRQTPLKLSEILDISIQTAAALSAAHESFLVHRDIKPENIIVRPDGFVKVLDFGLAKLVEHENKSVLGLDEQAFQKNETAKGVILGTVNYMSPEQAKGERVDERTDIFSLGVLIYEMIAGKTPFAGDSVSETFANLINSEPPPISLFTANVPDELQRIVSKTLRKKKDLRYRTMDGVLNDLKNLRENLAFDERLERVASSDDKITEIFQGITGDTNIQTAETRYGLSRQIKKRKSYAVFGSLLFVLAAAVGSWLALKENQSAAAPVLSAPLASEKISTNGKVFHAVITPDGKNVIYINQSELGKTSVWLRQLKTGGNREIIPPSDYIYFGLAISPDGNLLYLTRRLKSVEGQLDIYRVSISGGVPQKIIGETQGWISLSPDGANISFVRCYYRNDEYCSLWIADSADGANEKKLVSRPRPLRIADNQFSPDGKTIAFAAGQSNNEANEFGLYEIDLESGAERELTAEKFFAIGGLTWLPDKSGLLLTARKNTEQNDLIRQFSFVSGEISPLTKDSESYSSLSLDKDATALIATKFRQDFRLRLLNLNNPSEKFVLADALNAVFSPNGKIIFTSEMSGNSELWSVNADGSDQRQLTDNPARDFIGTVSPTDGSIFFVSNRTGKMQIWRMNNDGSNQTQITTAEGGLPRFVSPDGEWLYYLHGVDRTLWRVSKKGGEERRVFNQAMSQVTFSPDGLYFAYLENQGAKKTVVVASLADWRTVKILKIPEGYANVSTITFLPDGKSVAYTLKEADAEKRVLWFHPLDSKTPRWIADLGDEGINEYGFAFSPDGKTIAIAQGGWRHDAVLFNGLK